MEQVEEICYFSAGMRLPPSFTKAQVAKVAETVIDVLGMSHIRESKIGDEATRGISGGQRKRVNIAMGESTDLVVGKTRRLDKSDPFPAVSDTQS